MNYDPPDPSSKLQICTHRRCIIERRRRRRYLSPSLCGDGDFHDSGQMIVIIFPSQSIRPFAVCAAQSNERDFYELCDIGQWGNIEAVRSP